jgi:CBS domain-containing protein
MSPRAACRLATLGFTRVHDYAAGKVDWLAHGLPAEGTHASLPTAGTLARQDAATCTLDTPAAEALQAIDASRYGFALVLSRDTVLLGRLRRSALEAVAGDAPIEPILEPGPSTIRPHLTVEDLRQQFQRPGVRTLLVTRPDGTLIGLLRHEDIP